MQSLLFLSLLPPHLSSFLFLRLYFLYLVFSYVTVFTFKIECYANCVGWTLILLLRCELWRHLKCFCSMEKRLDCSATFPNDLRYVFITLCGDRIEMVNGKPSRVYAVYSTYVFQPLLTHIIARRIWESHRSFSCCDFYSFFRLSHIFTFRRSLSHFMIVFLCPFPSLCI